MPSPCVGKDRREICSFSRPPQQFAGPPRIGHKRRRISGPSWRNLFLDRSTCDDAGRANHLANRGASTAGKVYRKGFSTIQ
jgi:hypothetical protein